MNDENNDWLLTLDEQLGKSSSLAKFKDINTLAKSYLELEKSQTKSVSIPTEDAAEEEWDDFYNRLGRPNDKSYLPVEEITDKNKDFLEFYGALFHDSGLSARQGRKLLSRLSEAAKVISDNQQKETEALRVENIKKLKDKYGADFDSNIRIMEGHLKDKGDLLSFIDNSAFNPEIMDLVIEQAKANSDNSLITNGSSENFDVIAAKKEISKLSNNENFMKQYEDGNEEANKKLQELYAQAYPEEK